MKRQPAKVEDGRLLMLGGNTNIPLDDLLDCAHFSGDDIVLVAGTLMEGIGNIHSDLDCIVICDRRPNVNEIDGILHTALYDDHLRPVEGGEVHNTYDYLGADGLHVDFDYITRGEVSALADRVQGAGSKASEDWAILFEPLLTASDARLFHRLLSATAVYGGDAYEGIRSTLPRQAYLYTRFREAMPHYFMMKDVQGALDADDPWMAHELLRGMCANLTQAVLHLSGEGNPNPKWVMSLAPELATVGVQHAIGFRDLMMAGAVKEWECRRSIDAMLEYLDGVFDTVPDLMLRLGSISPAMALAQLEREFSSRHNREHILSRDEWDYRVRPLDPANGRSLRELILRPLEGTIANRLLTETNAQ